MTAEPTPTGERWASATERQEAARVAYRRSLDAGEALSGAELGRRFDRSAQWGRAIVAQVRQTDSDRDGDRHVDATVERPTASTDMSRTLAGSDHRPGPAGGADGPASERQRPTVGAQRIDTLIVAVVALVAAVASYEHQRTLGLLAGEGDLAWLLPVSVDGMMLATSRLILRRRRAGMRVPGLSWFGFLLGFLASVAANIVAVDPTVVDPVLVRRLMAAWPPVALFIAYETLAADHGDGSGR